MSWAALYLALMTAVKASPSTIQLKILEETEAGVLVGNIFDAMNLSDLCSGQTSQLRLEMEFAEKQEMDAGDVLELGELGDLRSKTKVDRDTICPSQANCVIAGELAIVRPSQCFAIVAVSLSIVDLNDNSPRFSPSYSSVSLSEASEVGSFVRLPLAQDDDSPQYGVRLYRLTASWGVFSLQYVTVIDGPGDLRLVLTSPLDRELKPYYDLEVVAEDWGKPPFTALLSVSVIVQDVNDNAPQFDKDLYNISLPENFLANVTFVTVLATDIDDGMNGVVNYRLDLGQQATQDNFFNIDPFTGDLSLTRQLDYETVRRLKVVVIAQDLGATQRSSTATVIINVVDTNDNAPRIYINTFTADKTAHVLENAPPGEFVAYLSVTDPDTGEGGEVKCNMQPDSLPFTIIATPNNQHKIITSQALDREQTGEYNVSIHCSNVASSHLTSYQHFSVIVDDVNDCFPEFSASSYVFTVEENNTPGVLLGKIAVIDMDSADNARVTMRIAEEEARKYVQLDSDSGQLRALIPLDRERISDLHLTVIAMDAGSPVRSSYVSVTVHVLDDNDESPRFSNASYHFQVVENSPKFTIVGQVRSSDRDLWPYNKTEYQLESANWVPFLINQTTGDITTLLPLDREDTKLYVFDVIAYDKLQPDLRSMATVTIEVTDVNDNHPVVVFPANGSGTVRISNRLLPSSSIFHIQAFDADNNGPLIFSLLPFADNHIKSDIVTVNISEYFAVNDAGGIVTATDMSSINFQIFYLQIFVSDAASPPMTSVVNLTIIVDSNVPLPRIDGATLFLGDIPLMLLTAIAIASTCLVIAMLVICVIIRYFMSKRHRAWAVRRREERKLEMSQDGAHALQPLMIIREETLLRTPTKTQVLFVSNDTVCY